MWGLGWNEDNDTCQVPWHVAISCHVSHQEFDTWQKKILKKKLQKKIKNYKKKLKKKLKKN